MSKVSAGTRARILKAAEELFADKGFSGSSIRDIAEMAKVNVASINYHFKDKLSLYMEIFLFGRKQVMDELDRQVIQKDCSLSEAVQRLFNVFFNERQRLANYFKLINSPAFGEGLRRRPDFIDTFTVSPMEKHLAKIIFKEAQGRISERESMVFSKIINDYVLHSVHMLSCPLGTELQRKKSISKKQFLNNISSLVELVLHRIAEKR